MATNKDRVRINVTDDKYQVVCDQHRYKSPRVRIFNNARDLKHAHEVCEHDHKIMPKTRFGYAR